MNEELDFSKITTEKLQQAVGHYTESDNDFVCKGITCLWCPYYNSCPTVKVDVKHLAFKGELDKRLALSETKVEIVIEKKIATEEPVYTYEIMGVCGTLYICKIFAGEEEMYKQMERGATIQAIDGLILNLNNVVSIRKRK